MAFNVADKAVHFGGCAGNIAYNAKLLKEEVVMLGIAGNDFGKYEERMKKHGIDTSHVIVEADEFTAEASVMTDRKGQQLTIFHGGASKKSWQHREEIMRMISSQAPRIAFAIVSPNHRDFVTATIDACAENKLPYFFDPGQAMPQFSRVELFGIIQHAAGLFLNEYELDLLAKLQKTSTDEIVESCPLVVVTLGEKGAMVVYEGKKMMIPTEKHSNPVDPTGCGDAFRAGFLTSIKPHFQKLTPEVLERASNVGTQLALACLGVTGTQNHTMS